MLPFSTGGKISFVAGGIAHRINHHKETAAHALLNLHE